MTDSAHLTVQATARPTDPSAGPLAVEVRSETGTPQTFVLTSGRRTHELQLTPGNYTIVARRPNGERIVRVTSVNAGGRETVVISPESGVRPRAPLAPELARGELEVPSLPATGTPELRPAGILAGFGGESLRLLAASSPKPYKRTLIGTRLTMRLWGAFDAVGRRPPPVSRDGQTFLKVTLKRPVRAQAVGLVDEHGFGPIVMVPPFATALSVTFLAQGLAVQATARGANPAGLRTPVAVALPEEPVLADLLSVIAAPLVDDARGIWSSNLGALEWAERALMQLSDKFARPAEAILAAHFLLRFAPDALPISWADRLAQVLPEVADAPVIAAWARLSGVARGVEKESAAQIDERVTAALIRARNLSRALFARARLLLVRGSSFLTGHAVSTFYLTADPARFLAYGAHAGGLEAFWGTGPLRPGPGGHPASNEEYRDVLSCQLSESLFQGTTSGTTTSGSKRPLTKPGLMKRGATKHRVAKRRGI